ncbi:MAG: hypothetical protein IPO88_31745 [Nannocystis sp.]|nr:choice-of-anchor Q domain-containing protein [Nannocystis sp.]MBK9758010.1 hypothetical protein [Nannocystis sp.]
MAGSPGGGTGSVYHEGVPLRLVDSTFADNHTDAHAGGLFLGGGTDAEVSNCTFSGNSTPGNAGALWAGNGVVAVGNSTFSGNSADYGPVFFKGEGGTVTLTNVVLADNSTANEFSALACHETCQDGGGNVQWPDIKNNGNPDTPCAAGVVFADPQLGPLADNGGPTRTMALGPAARPSTLRRTARSSISAACRARACVTRERTSCSREHASLGQHGALIGVGDSVYDVRRTKAPRSDVSGRGVSCLRAHGRAAILGRVQPIAALRLGPRARRLLRRRGRDVDERRERERVVPPPGPR